MKGSRFILTCLGLLCGMLALYPLAVPRIEALAIALWHDQVVKREVASREELLRGPAFRLGIFRPELPYHFQRVFEVEDSLDAGLSIISYYQAWGDGPEHELNPEVLANIARGGYAPLITWEPWVSAFDAYRGQVPDSSLALIARGTFDAYVREWAREAVRFGGPMFLRFAHEFSNPWYGWSSGYGNSKEDFIRAWRHVHGIFREEGARNVAWVWNPYLAADTAFYPGDEYVDWVGLDIFNFGPVVENGWWMDFFTLLHGLYQPMQRFGKPILIAETGTVGEGGNKAEWYRDLFRSLGAGSFPAVKALVLFDHPASKAPNGLTVDLSMTGDSTVWRALDAEGIRKLGLPPRRR